MVAWHLGDHSHKIAQMSTGRFNLSNPKNDLEWKVLVCPMSVCTFHAHTQSSLPARTHACTHTRAHTHTHSRMHTRIQLLQTKGQPGPGQYTNIPSSLSSVGVARWPILRRPPAAEPQSRRAAPVQHPKKSMKSKGGSTPNAKAPQNATGGVDEEDDYGDESFDES